MTSNFEITAIILSGGLGTRMGKVDKGLSPYQGKPLIEHMITRVRPQVSDLVISCNPSNKRDLNLYSKYGYALIEDKPELTQGTQKSYGPLAGILSASQNITTPLCFICPCDMPLIPLDLVQQLSNKMGGYEVVVARFEDNLQPLLTLISTEKIKTINQQISRDDLTVKNWLQTLNAVEVDIDGSSDQLRNFNYPDDLLK